MLLVSYPSHPTSTDCALLVCRTAVHQRTLHGGQVEEGREGNYYHSLQGAIRGASAAGNTGKTASAALRAIYPTAPRQ